MATTLLVEFKVENSKLRPKVESENSVNDSHTNSNETVEVAFES